MLSRSVVSVYYIDKEKWNLGVAVQKWALDDVREEASRLGEIRDGHNYNNVLPQFDFNLAPHGTYHPSEVATYLEEYGDSLI